MRHFIQTTLIFQEFIVIFRFEFVLYQLDLNLLHHFELFLAGIDLISLLFHFEMILKGL